MTGVQTCALPIWVPRLEAEEDEPERLEDLAEYERIIHHFESAHDAALAAEQYDS